MESYLSEGEVVRSSFRVTCSGSPEALRQSSNGVPDYEASKDFFFSVNNGVRTVCQRSIGGAPKEIFFHSFCACTSEVIIPGTLQTVDNETG